METSKISGMGFGNNSNINNTDNPFKSEYSENQKNPFNSFLSHNNNSMISNNNLQQGNNIDNDPSGEQFVFRLSQLSQQSQLRQEGSIIQNDDDYNNQNNSLMKSKLENSMLRGSNLSIDQNQQFASFGQSMIKDTSGVKQNNNGQASQLQYSQYSNFEGIESDLKHSNAFTIKDNSQLTQQKSNLQENVVNLGEQSEYKYEKSEMSEIRPPSDFQAFGQGTSSRFQSNFSNTSKIQMEGQGNFRSAPQKDLSKTMIQDDQQNKNVDYRNFASEKSDLSKPMIRQGDTDINQPIMEHQLENSSSYENKDLSLPKFGGHEIPRMSEESRYSEGKYLNPYRQSDQGIEFRNSNLSNPQFFDQSNRASEQQMQQYMPSVKTEVKNNQDEQNQIINPYAQKIEHIDDNDDQNNNMLMKTQIKGESISNNEFNRDSVSSFGQQKWKNNYMQENQQFDFQQPIRDDFQRYSIIPGQNQNQINQQYMEFNSNNNLVNNNSYRMSAETNNNRFSYNRSSAANRLSNQSQNNRLSFQSFKFDQQTGQSYNRTSALDSNRISAVSVIKEENFEALQKQFPGCTCTKTKCLKMYCICFQNQRDCGPTCRCIDCFNDHDHEDQRQHAVKQILHRNPDAFTNKIDQVQQDNNTNNNNINNMNQSYISKEASQLFQQPKQSLFDQNDKQLNQQQDKDQIGYKKGCNCRKTQCLKKYCECFNAGVKCHSLCKCDNCHNQENMDAMELEDRQQDLKPIEEEYTRQKILQKLSIQELQQLQLRQQQQQQNIVGRGIVD